MALNYEADPMTETYEFKENYNHRKIKRKIDKPSQIVYTPESEMEFEWDEDKKFKNWQKHGIDFAEAALMFENPIISQEDTRRDYGEKRFIAIGQYDGKYQMIVYTFRNDKIRLISARKASEDEKRKYQARYLRAIKGNEG